MSDRLTFSWFVGTCNLGHPATGPQEALWNTVKYSWTYLETYCTVYTCYSCQASVELNNDDQLHLKR
jgi:hypothetical protein